MAEPGAGYFPILVVIAIFALYIVSSIKILNEYERAVVFRLGRLHPVPKGPGVQVCAQQALSRIRAQQHNPVVLREMAAGAFSRPPSHVP